MFSNANTPPHELLTIGQLQFNPVRRQKCSISKFKMFCDLYGNEVSTSWKIPSYHLESLICKIVTTILDQWQLQINKCCTQLAAFTCMAMQERGDKVKNLETVQSGFTMLHVYVYCAIDSAALASLSSKFSTVKKRRNVHGNSPPQEILNKKSLISQYHVTQYKIVSQSIHTWN